MTSPVLLNEHESNCALGMKSRGAGTYRVDYGIKGDGMLSTVAVCSIDPGTTLQINYFETTTGKGCGERLDLASHILIDDTVTLPFNHTVCIPKFHFAPQLEAIVTGGNVEFGVYSSSKNISELDAILACPLIS